MVKLQILLILFLASGSCAFAQDPDSSDVAIPNIGSNSEKAGFMRAFCQDEIKIWTSPFRGLEKRHLYWIPVIGATVLSIWQDEKIYSAFKSYQSKHPWVDHVSPLITLGGENITVISECVLFYFGGLITGNQKAKKTGIMAAEALAHSGLIVTVGKITTGRQRPSFDHGKDHWNWFPESFNMYRKGFLKSGYDAFPSGHTIAAWSVATVIAKQYSDIKIIPVLCYTLASGVGLSRITEDTHWLSDVILGAALGYSIGNFVVRERSKTRFTILPVADGKSVMIHACLAL